jgi:hypothetical protein
MPPMDEESDSREVRLVSAQDADLGTPVQNLPALEAAAEDPVGGAAAEVWKEIGRGKNRFKIRDLFADERCTRAILGFLRMTEVGRRVKLKGAENTERGKGEDPGPEEEEDEDLRCREEAGGSSFSFSFSFSFFSSFFLFPWSYLCHSYVP